MQELGSDAGAAALKALANMVRTQALVMSFADVFSCSPFLFVALACAIPFVRRPRPAGAGGGH